MILNEKKEKFFEISLKGQVEEGLILRKDKGNIFSVNENHIQ
jgi:hypothetical protein